MRKGILFGLVLGALIYFFGPGLGLWEKDAPAAQPMTAAQTDKADAKTKEDGASDTKKGSEKTTASPVRTDKPAAQSASAQTESRPSTPLAGRVESISRASSLTGPMGTVQGPFALVKLTLANRGSSSIDIVSFNIRMVDTDGNSYAVSDSGMGVLFHKGVATFHMENISPGMQTTASVVFAMPAGATPAKILVKPHGLNQPTTEITL
jgi:hypothetical protein